MDRNGGKLRVYGRCSFRDAGRTGRGEETRVATLPKISGRVLTLSGCARKTEELGLRWAWPAVPLAIDCGEGARAGGVQIRPTSCVRPLYPQTGRELSWP